jgi:hypothetical protein
MILSRAKVRMPEPGRALPGRAEAMCRAYCVASWLAIAAISSIPPSTT